MDELRFRSQQSPRNESGMNSFVSPPRNRLPQPGSHDPRSNLPRRFTTDSGRVPTLSTLNVAHQRGPEPQDMSTNAVRARACSRTPTGLAVDTRFFIWPSCDVRWNSC